MRSRADTLRRQLEFALRVAALAALVVAVLLVSGAISSRRDGGNAPALFVSSRVPPAGARDSSGSLLTVVRQLLMVTGGPRPLHVLARTVPSDTARALLSAAHAAGVPLSWTDSTSGAAIALEASAVVDPRGGVVLRAAAPSGVALVFRDSAGLIDTVRTRTGGSTITVGRVTGSVVAESPSARAVATAPPAVAVRRLLLVASPGWEAKFTTAALEERGWTVDVRYALGRNTTVTQGTPLAPDTARYAAVIALDSSALAQAAALRRYVESGGGLVVAGPAATLTELGPLLPGHALGERPGVPGALATATPELGLSWRPIVPDSDAIVLARGAQSSTSDAPNATVVARRVGAGRVLLVGYSNVWEWRMAGPEGSVEAHRRWWSDLVARVAFAPDTTAGHTQAGADLPGAAAPYADLLVRLGGSGRMPPSAVRAGPARPWERLLLVVFVAALLVEWTSRRLRGAR